MTAATAKVIKWQAPLVLLPYQQRWLNDNSRVRIAEKSRRVGISWATAGEMALESSQKGGCDGWYVGYNKEMAQEFIRDCAYWSERYQLAASAIEESVYTESDNEILMFVIRFNSGFRITALSSRPANLRNKRGHIVVDEAAHHEDLRGLLKAAMAVTMWGGKSRVDIISTHNGVENYFNQLVEEVRARKRPYGLHRITLDDALEEGLYKRIQLVNNEPWSAEAQAVWRAELFAQYGDDAQEELLCVPARGGGIYLRRDLIERQMKPGKVVYLSLEDGFVTWSEDSRKDFVKRWCDENIGPLLSLLPKDRHQFFGVDFGRVSDRTVIAPGYLGQDLVRRSPFAVELSNVPFEQQKDVLCYIGDRMPKLLKGALDATGNGAYLAEAAMLRYGQDRIECVNITESWYSEHLPVFKAGFEDALIEVVRDADHLVDLSQFKTINGRPKLPNLKTKPTKADGPPRHGDAAIAYLMFYYAANLPISDYAYTAGTRFKPSTQKNNVLSPGKPGFKQRSGGIF